MLPGPVFALELSLGARRARTYVLRFLYGVLLLVVIWVSYEQEGRYTWRPGGVSSVKGMARFARATFEGFLLAQSAAVLVLTPALLAGAVAEESQRGTLPDLLTSRLSSGEIVLGKLAARLLHVGAYVAIGVPVLSLLTLFGGVDPAEVLHATAVTLTTAFFLAGLSVLVSTGARRVRDALWAIYLVELAWLAVPAAVEYLMKGQWPRLYGWVGPASLWLNRTSPLALAFDLVLPGLGGASTPAERVGWTLGLQSACGAAFVALAVFRLRPAARAAGAPAWRGRSWARRRPRPAIDDDPMLWKEMNAGRPGGLVRALARLVALAALVPLAYEVFAYAAPAFAELARYGYGIARTRDREPFNIFLRFVGVLLYMLGALGVAAAAASGVTAEREGGTWVSLASTDLDGREILSAKMFGAIWGRRRLWALLVLLWTLGLAAGAIHPLGFVAAVVELAVFVGFAAALGTYVSLWSRSTTRATALTIALMAFLNGGYLFCCLPVRGAGTLVLTGCTPSIQFLSLQSYDDFWAMLGRNPHRNGPDLAPLVDTLLACILGVGAYAVAAIALAWAAVHDFDAAVDRPWRERPAAPVEDLSDAAEVDT
jgi:hypothetical protein